MPDDRRHWLRHELVGVALRELRGRYINDFESGVVNGRSRRDNEPIIRLRVDELARLGAFCAAVGDQSPTEARERCTSGDLNWTNETVTILADWDGTDAYDLQLEVVGGLSKANGREAHGLRSRFRRVCRGGARIRGAIADTVWTVPASAA